MAGKWIISRQGQHFSLDPTHAKLQLLHLVLDTLKLIADDEGFDSYADWLTSPDFDPDLLLGQGADFEKNGRWTNYYWEVKTGDTRRWRVSLSLEIPKGKRKAKRFLLNAMDWQYIEVPDSDD